MKIKLFQSYYKPEQKINLDIDCVPYDNTTNPNPDLREYPQMRDVHNQCRLNSEAYGLISWKFNKKAMIPAYRFRDFVCDTRLDYDFWFVNPCYILDGVFLSPWFQGEMHHPGMMQLAQDTLNKMQSDVPQLATTVFPSGKTFYANYFMAKPHVWDRLFSFTDTFYSMVEKDRMNKPSGYSGDPNMSHFIFLFERLVPTFLLMNDDISVGKYDYRFIDVSKKSNPYEYKMVKTLAEMKDEIVYIEDDKKQLALNAHTAYRDLFMSKYPNAFGKE
jgi:hypothetical protein